MSITQEQIEATRQTLRERVQLAAAHYEPHLSLRNGWPALRAALDALVAFERAEARVQELKPLQFAVKAMYAMHEAEATLAQIIKDTGAVQE